MRGISFVSICARVHAWAPACTSMSAPHVREWALVVTPEHARSAPAAVFTCDVLRPRCAAILAARAISLAKNAIDLAFDLEPKHACIYCCHGRRAVALEGGDHTWLHCPCFADARRVLYANAPYRVSNPVAVPVRFASYSANCYNDVALCVAIVRDNRMTCQMGFDQMYTSAAAGTV